MSAFSDYIEESILNATLRGTAMPTLPSTLYVGLATAAIDESYVGATPYASTELDPATQTSYARATVTFGAPTAAAAGGGMSCSNDSTALFPQAGSAWGTISHFGIFDAATGGNLIYAGALTTPETVTAKGTLEAATGQLVVTVQ